ncbi:MAG: peptide deformylase [Gordonibacter pamelaeae]|uniref:peptide deformylase n=1 Tax=Gordonibacter massiliensis (ex Traore et al. 2017) TaxID=1841863 RepID=UPI001C8BBAE0|nr:peptide deformylase [Gordonibacter massiliensis (ex Traore et al. 2017)]MBX9034350.1 formylmethionine deformylase [Gordonibacter massiliensis (ex Traore et al. 2017)]
MIKELVKDETALSQPCEAATAEDAETAQDLLDTLASLEGAACLAANQIGVAKRVVAYLDDNDQPHVMYNPVLKQALGAFKAVEGCLSLEAESKVTRYDRVKVAYDELVDGELVPRKKDFTGWTAQTIQHMIDHCKGKLV